ncbi:DUF362 domain-containing protein [Eubacteriaceae bacterium ES3]|nr:DUF362 domain-containing protein [Eubacteriaceae bacterium ES3]
MEKVAIENCQSYDYKEIDQSIRNGLAAISLNLPIKMKVLLKPNLMSQNKPDQHTITHWMLVEVLAQMLIERNCDVLIGDSISFFESGLTQKAFESSKLLKVAEKTGAHLVAFEGLPLKKFEVDIPGMKDIFIPEILFDVDMVISLPKLKTHSTMRLSGGIKNIFGCLPGGYKQHIHRWMKNEFELANVFIKLHQLIRPSLSIMDAVVSLDGGPTALGRPVKTGCLLFSTNPAAMDYTAAQMIGYQPDTLPLLLEAQKMGLIDNYDNVEVVGTWKTFNFKRLVKADPNRPLSPDSLFVKHTYIELFISKNKCTRCGVCQNYCPVNAISEIDGRLRLDNKTCIHCYGCLLNCPENAIFTRVKPMNMLIRGVRKVIGI